MVGFAGSRLANKRIGKTMPKLSFNCTRAVDAVSHRTLSIPRSRRKAGICYLDLWNEDVADVAKVTAKIFTWDTKRPSHFKRKHEVQPVIGPLPGFIA
jgi:hypothetical protein